MSESIRPPVTTRLGPEEAFCPSVPFLNLELTTRCNLKCPYCANPALPRPYGAMEWTLIREVVRQAAESGYLIWSVTGVGEPLLRSDLEEVYALMRDHGVGSGWLCTNGTLLTAARARSLSAAGVEAVYVSLDTMDPELYRRTRGGDLVRTLSNVRAVLEALPDLPVVVGLMNHREQCVDEKMVERLHAEVGDSPNLHHHVVENGRFPSAPEDWRRLDTLGRPMAGGAWCNAPAYYFTIAIDGRVSLCCADQGMLHSLGDLNRQSIDEVWFDRRNQEMLRRVMLGLTDCPDVCYRCVLAPSALTLAEVDPVLAGPWSALARQADAELQAGRRERAMSLYEHLRRRDPWNRSISQIMEREFGVPDGLQTLRPPPPRVTRSVK